MKRWPTKALGESLKVQNGFAFKSELFNEDGKGLPIIRIRDLARGFSETFYDGEHESAFEVENGDFLIGMDGEFRCYRWQGGKALLNQRVCRLQNFSRDLNASYIFYGINDHLRQIEDNTAFVTVKHVSSKQIAAIEMSVLPLAEQERIVTLLDEADELRKLRAQADRRTAALLPALYHEMFGDPDLNPKSWPVKTLEQLAERLHQGINTAADKVQYQAQGYPILQSKHITSGRMEIGDARFVSKEDFSKYKDRFRPRVGNILFTNIGTIGKSVIVEQDTDLLVAWNIFLIALQSDVLPVFVNAFLQLLDRRGYFTGRNTGTATQFVSKGQMQAIKVPVPPMLLQMEFAQRVLEIREMEAGQAASRHRLEALFQSLLHRAFNGEL